MIGGHRRAATFRWLPMRCDGWGKYIEEKVRSPTWWTWCQPTTRIVMEKEAGRLSARAPHRPRVDHADHKRRSHGQNQGPFHRPLLRTRSAALRTTTTPRTILYGRSSSRRWAIPSGRALVLRTEPRRGRVSALRASIPIAAHRWPHADSQAAWVRGRRGTACARWVTARRPRRATVRGHARQEPVTGPCRPARRSRGAADRRPRRPPRGTPCP